MVWGEGRAIPVSNLSLLTEHEIHDAVSDEEDGDVPSDVFFVGERRHEAVVADVIEEVNAKEGGYRRGVQGEVPAVIGDTQEAHEVVDERASEHVKTEKGEVRGAEPDVVGEKLGELVHDERDLHKLSLTEEGFCFC